MAEGRKNTLIIEYIRYRVCKRQIFNVFESYKKKCKKKTKKSIFNFVRSRQLAWTTEFGGFLMFNAALNTRSSQKYVYEAFLYNLFFLSSLSLFFSLSLSIYIYFVIFLRLYIQRKVIPFFFFICFFNFSHLSRR